MAPPIEKLRELLSRPPTDDTAKLLKEWRAQAGYSQSEAAIRLGVPVRTLQGWELGRPMPYPSLLPTRPHDRFSLVQSEFPREFAEFIDFVGGADIESALRKVEQKLGSVSAQARSLYGDRYFFHEQCISFTYGSTPFLLDVSDLRAVRSASLIAGINRVRRSLSQQGSARLRSMVIDNLKPDRDVRQIEHEIRCATHFGRKGFQTTFADLEGKGNYDLLVETKAGFVEVECKTVTEDTGSQIKSDLNVDMSETFRKVVGAGIPVDESGLFILKLKKPSANCKNLARQLREALQGQTPGHFEGSDFSLEFSSRPQWQELWDSGQALDLRRQILLDPALGNHARCVTKVGNRIIGLILQPHKPTVLGERITDVIQAAADQCSGDNVSMVWVHLVGLPEAEFQTLAEFSMAGKGAGLNALVANAMHPSASSTKRTHVQTIRFSSDGGGLTRSPALRPDLLIGNAVSSSGTLYDVPNPHCAFPAINDPQWADQLDG
jgi:hypothetical protein